MTSTFSGTKRDSGHRTLGIGTAESDSLSASPSDASETGEDPMAAAQISKSVDSDAHKEHPAASQQTRCSDDATEPGTQQHAASYDKDSTRITKASLDALQSESNDAPPQAGTSEAVVAPALTSNDAPADMPSGDDATQDNVEATPRQGHEALPIDIPEPPPTNNDISSLLIPRPTSSSSSTSSIGDCHSQAISARSSPSTVAPNRRRSAFTPLREGSGLEAMGSADSQDWDDHYFIPLKIRDYAFEEVDPRHVGARDVSAVSPSHSRSGFNRGLVDEGDGDDDEEGGQHGYASGQAGTNSEGVPEGLPIGLYHAAYDFEAESEHELSVKTGEKVRLIGHVDGGWAIVVRVEEGQEDKELSAAEIEEVADVNKGLVPEAYLEWLG